MWHASNGMPVNGPEVVGRSRRAFLALAAGSWWLGQPNEGRSEVLPADARRYLDPATEFPLVRLTEPNYNSYLTAPYNRGISVHNFLLFSSDREGKLDAYRVEFKGGQWQRLTQAEHLDPASLALLPNDHGFCYIDGPSFRVSDFGKLRDREIYALAAPYESLSAVALAPDGSHAYVVERGQGRSRIRLVPFAHGTIANVLETEDEISDPLPRPGGGIAYRVGSSLHFADRPNNNQATLPLATGKNGPFYWSPDGSSLLYLNIPEKQGELNNIREFILAKNQDRLLAKTTQFVQFAPNANATVFVGASGSKASPHVLILLRSTRRELTLCEHRAKDLQHLSVAFSPNSQRIVFQSDQHGKPAIYIMPVERFVAETESLA